MSAPVRLYLVKPSDIQTITNRSNTKNIKKLNKPLIVYYKWNQFKPQNKDLES